jgi:hypothetical protein
MMEGVDVSRLSVAECLALAEQQETEGEKDMGAQQQRVPRQNGSTVAASRVGLSSNFDREET